MPSNTTYNPPNVNAFVKSALQFDAQGINGTITAGQTGSIEYTLVDDCLLTGVEIIVNNGAYGDTASLQVIDASGALTGTVGTVLLQVATNWNVSPVSDIQFQLTYPAKVTAGMGLRMNYTSTGSQNVFAAINFELHKCLV